MTTPNTENFRSTPKWTRTLGTGLVVSLIATFVSHWAPVSMASLLVALVFVSSTYLLCLRRNQPEAPSHFGLSLGGVFEAEPLSARRLATSFAHSTLWASAAAALIFPFFALAFPLYHNANESFSLQRAINGLLRNGSWLDVIGGQLLVVALPEEAFFRGYLQTRLTESFPEEKPRRILPSGAILLTSALFALGHFATIPSPARLAVFFPSLVFGILRRRTGSIGASVLFHALSNLFSALLLSGYGLL